MIRKIFEFVLFLLFIPVYPIFWIVCRLTAKQCPNCRERYFTELIGEWDGEDWRCSRCNHFWTVIYHELKSKPEK